MTFEFVFGTIYLIGVVLAVGRGLAAAYSKDRGKISLLAVFIGASLSWSTFVASTILYFVEKETYFLCYRDPRLSRL